MQLRTVASLLPISLALVLAPAASAQSFNLDVGANQTHPLPSTSYGAAANQPGTWVGVTTTAQIPVALADITGTGTLVTVTPTGGFGDFAVNNPTWSGDDDLLMEDASDVGAVGAAPSGSIAWTIAGLAAGTYEVYTYALAPDFPASYFTLVSVAGAVEPTQNVGGAWSGSPHVLGVSYAKHTVAVAAGGNLVVTTATNPSPAGNLGTVNGFQVKQLSISSAFCSGDGLDPVVTTACSCGNFGAPGNGCANSVNPAGATLSAAGTTSPDTIVLSGSGMPASVSCIYLQGTGLDDAVFGDGVRCAGGTLLRLRTRANVGGTSAFPDSTDTITLSARGGVTPGSGAVRYYQTYYRNSAPVFCPPETFNVTNGWQITW